MDPSNYPTKDISFGQSDDNISPLHQRYYSNSEAPPPQPHPGFAHAPPASTIASAEPVQSPVENEQELMRSFLTIPVGKFLSVDERVRVSSMEPPSITSLLQGNKTAILHAHLDIAGALDPDPIFQDPASNIPKEKEMRKLLGSSSSHGNSYGKMPYVKPTYFDQSPMSSHVQREQQVPSVVMQSSNSDDAIRAAINSTFEFTEVQRYTCKLCDAIFTTPQTYYSHMSLHNKGMSSN
ncbi:hypothetical protein PAHAL_5G394600 [Panicum hallii]|uniref:C2H2-type domain-containing protein n=1 Tax=Panicum hallii TaxID=206008 RepID=A0A2S3HVW3_9POAL|nr:hypothetical protein PAHAL_5G394600 [Panicum hallii]